MRLKHVIRVKTKTFSNIGVCFISINEAKTTTKTTTKRASSLPEENSQLKHLPNLHPSKKTFSTVHANMQNCCAVIIVTTLQKHLMDKSTNKVYGKDKIIGL